jgi:hypothetical protein
MTQKHSCSSCESLKEQIEEIKKSQIEECRKENEDSRRKISGMQGKILALTIASTVAFTVVGQEAVEKIQKLIESITSVQNIANPDIDSSGDSESKGSSQSQTNNLNSSKLKMPSVEQFRYNSGRSVTTEVSIMNGDNPLYVATSSDYESPSFSNVKFKPRQKSQTSSKESMESIVQPEQLPEPIPTIDLAGIDIYATPPVISMNLTSTQLPDIDMTPEYRMAAISTVPAPSTVSALLIQHIVKQQRRRA